MAQQDLIDRLGAPVDGAPMGALLSAQAAAAPDRPCLTADGVTLSRAAFDARANRRARWLAGQGVRAGDTVMIALPNSIAWYETAFAVWKLGAVPAHVSHRLADPEFEAIVALARPALIVTHRAGPRCVPPTEPDAAIDAGPLPPAIPPHTKLATSGGSTGRPKLILDPKPGVWGPDKGARRRKPGSTIINPAPLHHSAPFGLMLPAIAQGGHVIDPGRFDAEEYLTLAAAFRCDWAYLVPTMMARIMQLPASIRASYDLHGLETVLHMAAPCAPWLKRAWIDWLGPDVIWEVYGGTERIGATIIGGAEWLAHPGSVGRPDPGTTLAILDDDGAAVPAGTIGQVYFRNTGAAPFTYIGAEPDRRGEWVSFGDSGHVDAAGYLFIADRRTDMVLSGGVNFYPAEIEAVLECCPGVRGSVVVGAPDDDLGQILWAAIETHPADPNPPNGAALLAWLDGRLERRKWPRRFIFVTEPIRDDAGKVRRSAWRARLLAATEPLDDHRPADTSPDALQPPQPAD